MPQRARGAFRRSCPHLYFPLLVSDERWRSLALSVRQQYKPRCSSVVRALIVFSVDRLSDGAAALGPLRTRIDEILALVRPDGLLLDDDKQPLHLF